MEGNWTWSRASLWRWLLWKPCSEMRDGPYVDFSSREEGRDMNNLLSTLPLIYCCALLAKSSWELGDIGGCWCGSMGYQPWLRTGLNGRHPAHSLSSLLHSYTPERFYSHSLLVSVILGINKIKMSTTQILVN